MMDGPLFIFMARMPHYDYSPWPSNLEGPRGGGYTSVFKAEELKSRPI